MNKAAEVLAASRKVSRPTTLEFIDRLCEEFIELHGDR